MKDLEAELKSLQHQLTTINSEKDKLAREVAKIRVEKNKLRMLGRLQPNEASLCLTELGGPAGISSCAPTDNSSRASTNPRSDVSLQDTPLDTLRLSTIGEETDESLLEPISAWNYIQAHELFRKGYVDVSDVYATLENMARYNGRRSAFQASDVGNAITECAFSRPRDRLI